MNLSPNPFRLLALLLLLLPSPGRTQDSPWVIEGHSKRSQLQYDFTRHLVRGTNGITVQYQHPQRGLVELSAGTIELNQETGAVDAEGRVSLKHGGVLWRGEKLEYNFKTHALKGSEFRLGSPPFFVSGLKLGADTTNKVQYAENAVITADDVSEPGYRVVARALRIYPGSRIEAEQATVYLGKVPVFYLPKYTRSLERSPSNFTYVPGYRSTLGPFLLTRFDWAATTNFFGAVHLDYRQRRGFAGGPDFGYDLGVLGRGELKYYYANDTQAGTNFFGAPISEHRHQVKFYHEVAVTTNLTARALIRYQNDPYLLRDFFDGEYRRNVQPSSFIEINQLWPNLSLNVLAQPRLMDFFETVERLPDVKLSALRMQLGQTPLFYESDTSIGYFQRRFSGNVMPSYAAMRGNTFHQVVLPKTLFGWLNVTPRVGGRFTHYGQAHGPGAATVEQERAVFNTGVETSFKASRVWPGLKNQTFEMDGLRHIFEPSVNYVYVPRPNVTPDRLPQFDSDQVNFRLPPIDFPDNNSIDSIDSQNVLRLGLRNRIQTKRAGQIDNVVNWSLFSDWRLQPHATNHAFSDLFSELDFKPRSWLTFSSETRYDVNRHEWRLADHRMTIQPDDFWSVSLGHRYFLADPSFGTNAVNNNLITSSVFFRLNENWGFRMSQQLEARDGTIEEHFYSVYRDFRSWTGALTCRFRDNRNGREDFTIGFTFSLKAVSRMKLNADRDYPTMLFGG